MLFKLGGSHAKVPKRETAIHKAGDSFMNTDQIQPPGAEAWLLSFNNELNAAVGGRELQHIIHSPITFTVPLCPFYCDEVLIWNDQLLPVIDLASWLTEGRKACRNALIGIVAYQPHDRQTLHYAGLQLDRAPRRLKVYDNQACALPEDVPIWHKIAVSCFKCQDDTPVPILDLPSVFSASPHISPRTADLGEASFD